MDCEMVGVGVDGLLHALARCSLVNSLGHVLLDRYVLPLEPITDYRTPVSGIRPSHMATAHPFKAVQADVAALLKGRILVGHGLHSDLAVLQLSHPRAQVRDTARWKGLCPKRPKGLKALVEEHLGLEIQQGEHDSVVDARATLALYLKFRAQWEAERRGQKAKPGRGATAQTQETAVKAQTGATNKGDADEPLYSSEGPVHRNGVRAVMMGKGASADDVKGRKRASAG